MRHRGTYGLIFVNKTRTAGAQRSATTADITSTTASPERSAVADGGGVHRRTSGPAPTRRHDHRRHGRRTGHPAAQHRPGSLRLRLRLQLVIEQPPDVFARTARRQIAGGGRRPERKERSFLGRIAGLLFVVMKGRQMAVCRN